MTDTDTDTPAAVPVEREQLAAERTFLASERTTMATYRTSVSLIGFGISFLKVSDVLENNGSISVNDGVLEFVGFAFIVIACLTSGFAFYLNYKFEARMKAAGILNPDPISVSRLLGAAVIGVALVAIVLIVL